MENKTFDFENAVLSLLIENAAMTRASLKTQAKIMSKLNNTSFEEEYQQVKDLTKEFSDIFISTIYGENDSKE